MKVFVKSICLFLWILISSALGATAANTVGSCEWEYAAGVLTIKACNGVVGGVLEPEEPPTSVDDLLESYPYRSYIKTIECVVISPGVDRIGDYAFYGFKALRKVQFVGTPTIASIGNYAFYGDSRMFKIEAPQCTRVEGLPESVRQIGDFSFAKTNLTSFVIPEACESIGMGVLANIANMKSVVSYASHYFKVSDDGSLLMDAEETEIILALTKIDSLYIPDGVEVIRSGAFYNNQSLVKISGGKDLVSIEDRAFEGASSLRIVCLIGKGAITLGENAFDASIVNSCVATVANDVTVSNFKSQISNVYNAVCGENMYWYVSDDKTTLYIVGSGNMSDFEETAPWYALNSSITTVNFSGNCLSIGKNAFSGMTRISKFTGDLANISDAGDAAFKGVTSLTAFSFDAFPALSTLGSSSFSGLKMQQITIPNSVVSIGSNALYSTSLLKIFDNSTTDIDTQQFSNAQKQSCVVYVTTAAQKEKYVAAGLASANVFVSNCDNDRGLLTWNFESSTGKLSFAGSGEIYDYGEGGYPWESIKPQIKEVELLASATSIPSYAFAGCISLSSIHNEGKTDISSVKTIGSYAFQNAAFEEFTFHKGLKSVGVNPFADNEDLAKLNVATSAFSDKDKIEGLSKENLSIYVVSEDAGLAENIYNFFKQTAKFEHVIYKNCGNTLTWTVQNGVLVITNTSNANLPCSMWTISDADHQPWAEYRASIKAVNLPDKLTNISSYAFAGCANLKSIQIPLLVDEIGAHAFGGTGITEMKIPASVAYIDAWGNNSLQTIVVDPANKHYTTSDDKGNELNILFDKDYVELHICPATSASISLPKTLTSVGEAAFNGSVGKLTIPASVKTMNSWPTSASAIYASNVPTTYAAVPASLKTVELFATNATVAAAYKKLGFSKVSTLASCGENAAYTLEGGVLTIYGSGAVSSHPWMLTTASSIKRVVIEQGITSLCKEVFKGCSALTNLTLPNGLETIGASFIEGCSLLKSLYIPNSVKELDPAAFKGHALTAVEAQAGGAYISADANGNPCNALYSADGKTLLLALDPVVTNTVTTIASYAFAGSTVTNLNIPASVTTIADNAFADASITNIYSASKASVLSAAFSETVKAKAKLYLSDADVKALYVAAGFDESKMTVADGKCGKSLYYLLKSNKLTIFGSGAMNNYATVATPWAASASSITSLTFIGEAITAISDSSFNGCALKGELNIPSSVKTIGKGAFASSKAITSVVAASANPATLANAFAADVYANAQLVVPVGAKQTYAAAPNWEKFGAVADEEETKNPYDLNGDARVNSADISVLLQNLK